MSGNAGYKGPIQPPAHAVGTQRGEEEAVEAAVTDWDRRKALHFVNSPEAADTSASALDRELSRVEVVVHLPGDVEDYAASTSGLTQRIAELLQGPGRSGFWYQGKERLADIIPDDVSVRMMPDPPTEGSDDSEGSVQMVFVIDAHDNPSARFVRAYLTSVFHNVVPSAIALNMKIDSPVLLPRLPGGHGNSYYATSEDTPEVVHPNAKGSLGLASSGVDVGRSWTSLVGVSSPPPPPPRAPLKSYFELHPGFTAAAAVLVGVPLLALAICCFMRKWQNQKERNKEGTEDTDSETGKRGKRGKGSAPYEPARASDSKA